MPLNLSDFVAVSDPALGGASHWLSLHRCRAPWRCSARRPRAPVHPRCRRATGPPSLQAWRWHARPWPWPRAPRAAVAPGGPSPARPGGPRSWGHGGPRPGNARPAPRRPQRTRARAAGRRAPCLLGRAGAARRLARACGGHRRPRSRWGGGGDVIRPSPLHPPARWPARWQPRPSSTPPGRQGTPNPVGNSPGGAARHARPGGARTPKTGPRAWLGAGGRGRVASRRPPMARCRRGTKRPSGWGQRAGAWRPLRPAARARCRVTSRRTALRRRRPTPVGRGRSREPRASWPDAHRPWGCGGVAGSSPSQETRAAGSAGAPCATSRRWRRPH